jgi:hypothetical protein
VTFSSGLPSVTSSLRLSTLGDRLTAGLRALNPRVQVQVLLPEPVPTLRGRLTAGSDALNVANVGSNPTPAITTDGSGDRSYATEVIRLDEEPDLKTGGGFGRLWVRVPRLPPDSTFNDRH